jgi:hypothetical protein
LRAAAKLLLGKNATGGSTRSSIVVKEQRTARIDRGTAIQDLCCFGEVNSARGYCASKKIKGDDFTVVYQITATWHLKVNRKTQRVVEECHIKFSTVNILSGRTVAWSNTQRVGGKGCLLQQERDRIAEIVIAYPKKANFHLLEFGSPAHRRAIAQGTSSSTPHPHITYFADSLSLICSGPKDP